MTWTPIVNKLRSAGVDFVDGLTDDEVACAENTHGFRFPDDLRSFLQTAVPTGPKFPDWRQPDSDELEERLRRPLEDILFDVERNDFWLPEWPSRPATATGREAVVTQLITAAPTLIPIYSHRMMPDRPSTAGNPVFSVHQTDIICYGATLEQYLFNEFLRSEGDDELRISPEPRRIEFWDIDRFQEVRWL
jgi:hypothetical protein